MLLQVLFGGFAALITSTSAQSNSSQILVVDQKSFNVLKPVPPPSQSNLTTIFVPPGVTLQQALAKPFHVYDESFLEIIGPNPTLTLIASTSSNPLFHEAVVWYPPTDEIFFVQNAGATAAGTGLNKSNIIQKISLNQAASVSSLRNASGQVDVVTVNATPPVINSNGATQYRGQLLFTGEGQGNDTAPALYVVNPRPPYNASMLVNNYFGRQWNSLNDVAVNPMNGDVYFTDTLYGYLQDFRPSPELPNQVYRFTPSTGAVSVVADGFDLPNGITFSPNGSYAYVTDTGAQYSFFGYNMTAPASIYQFTVLSDGTFANRKLFTYSSVGIPDGIHCDTNGNVYSGVGDGVHVWNPSGKLLGKIFLGTTSANFNFAGKGRMVICAETELYYATLAAEGAVVSSQLPPI
ncbi:gluconolactonase [Cladophialophora psammophila CBS 110553]|uniref:Gluconolactonase n=1 Tax=Cladophialophora psammophila CBS 110553 TaxID=1182543 RepID=W9WGH2_9EURO|nr:gluconolactonase [Cladophialophora psammophila CBS 110553]EXJ67013.1 gluconolactonase [Cladophialophora psammophila CBS 110553]